MLSVSHDDLISFVRDTFEIHFTYYRPTSHLQQFEYGQSLFGKYRKSVASEALEPAPIDTS